jgi:hypothetical protein
MILVTSRTLPIVALCIDYDLWTGDGFTSVLTPGLQVIVLSNQQALENACIGSSFEKKNPARRQWLTPVILATQEAEIRKIAVGSQPGANSSQNPISKNIHHRKGLVELAQAIRVPAGSCDDSLPWCSPPCDHQPHLFSQQTGSAIPIFHLGKLRLQGHTGVAPKASSQCRGWTQASSLISESTTVPHWKQKVLQGLAATDPNCVVWWVCLPPFLSRCCREDQAWLFLVRLQAASLEGMSSCRWVPGAARGALCIFQTPMAW